jgi:hypothetical protein
MSCSKGEISNYATIQAFNIILKVLAWSKWTLNIYIATNTISSLPSPIYITQVGCLNLKYSMNTERNFPPGVTFSTPYLVWSSYGKDVSPLPRFLIYVLQ